MEKVRTISHTATGEFTSNNHRVQDDAVAPKVAANSTPGPAL
jgi:hypothetical protein